MGTSGFSSIQLLFVSTSKMQSFKTTLFWTLALLCAIALSMSYEATAAPSESSDEGTFNPDDVELDFGDESDESREVDEDRLFNWLWLLKCKPFCLLRCALAGANNTVSCSVKGIPCMNCP